MTLFSDLKIRTKIILGFSVTLLFLIIIGLTEMMSTQHISKSIDSYLLESAPRMRAVLEIKNSSNKISHLLGEFEQLENATDPFIRAHLTNELHTEFEKINYWENTHLNKNEFAAIAALKEALMNMTLEMSTFLEQGAVSTGAYNEKIAQLEQKWMELDAAIELAITDEVQYMERVHQESHYLISLTELIVLSTLLFAVMFGIIAMFLIARSVSLPLVRLSDAVSRYTLGKFTERVHIATNDEIGMLAKNFNTMAGRLQESYTRLDEKTKSLGDQTHAILVQNENLEKTKTAMLSLLEDAKLLEESLRQERDRVKAIITSMIEGLVVTDEHHAIVMLNPAAARFLGVNAYDVEGRDIRDVIPLYHGDELLSPTEYPMVRVLENRLTIAIDLEDNINFRKDQHSREIPIAMTMSTLISGNSIVGGICIFRDITVLKQLDEAKVNFISIASHQLRTPLTSMRWFSEMLLDGEAGPLNEDQKHFIERVYQGTDRMISLVNLLLQIARVEAGRLRVEPKPLDLVAMTRGVLLTLKAGLDAKKQTVNIVTHPEALPAIPMDQEVIWQVIQNLLTNANRYSFEGGVITVTITQKGRVIEYAIKDNGIGIPPDQAPKLFEKFFRADNALQMVPEGSGLGLSLVRSLVEGWGGKIWFESEVNKGTTFFFTIGVEGMKEKSGVVSLVV